jgi:hypothetical protein
MAFHESHWFEFRFHFREWYPLYLCLDSLGFLVLIALVSVGKELFTLFNRFAKLSPRERAVRFRPTATPKMECG